jgi:hypothetical protein
MEGEDAEGEDEGVGAGAGVAGGGVGRAAGEGKSVGMHPKLGKLAEIVTAHFTETPNSRVIVFSQVP